MADLAIGSFLSIGTAQTAEVALLLNQCLRLPQAVILDST